MSLTEKTYVVKFLATIRMVGMVLCMLKLVLTVLLPIFFLWWMFRVEYSWLDWLLKVLLVGSYFSFSYLAADWSISSYYLRFLLLVLFFIATVWSLFKQRGLLFFVQRRYGSLSILYSLSIIAVFLALSYFVLAGRQPQTVPIHLSFPLQEGMYYISHGGSSSIINYHYGVCSAQRYALDILKLNRWGARARGLYPKDLEKYYIWADTVYSPCTGLVVSVADGFVDQKPGSSNGHYPAGNHIVLAYEGVSILIAHLQEGSIQVEAGEWVEVGQPLARVGNSGNTSEPHIHIHAERGDNLFRGEGVPIIFEERFLVRNDTVYKP